MTHIPQTSYVDLPSALYYFLLCCDPSSTAMATFFSPHQHFMWDIHAGRMSGRMGVVWRILLVIKVLFGWMDARLTIWSALITLQIFRVGSLISSYDLQQMCAALAMALNPALLTASTLQPCRNAILLLKVSPWPSCCL